MEDENIAKPAYQERFDSFIEAYKSGQTSGEIVGEVIAHMAQEFANYNMILATKELRLSKIAAEKVQSTDETTGKPISVSKADILVKATVEYEDVKRTKTDLENIEQYINALKYLQKGVLNEYSHMNT
jgi:hypothetical protein